MFGLLEAVTSGYTQSFPPKPAFTEDSISDLSGKVKLSEQFNSAADFLLTPLLRSTSSLAATAALAKMSLLSSTPKMRPYT